jgi:capsular exopolysaccharide synthesis family protein
MSKIFEALQNANCRIRNFDWRPVIDNNKPRQHEPSRIAIPDIRIPGDVTAPEDIPAAPDIRMAQYVPVPQDFRIAAPKVRSSSPLVPFDGRDPRAGEQYRILRTRIIQHPSQPRIVVVSSAAQGDGKSTTATNLAFAAALCSNVKVLLVDGDMRRGTIAPELGLDPSPGLAEFLTGVCKLDDITIQCEQLPNLHIFTAGKWHANPSELLDSELWRSTCTLLRDRYRLIVLDSPPIGAVADYDLLQSSADGVLLVLRPDNTKRQMASKAIDSVPKSKFLGVVLNSVSGWLAAEHHGHSDLYYQHSRHCESSAGHPGTAAA